MLVQFWHDALLAFRLLNLHLGLNRLELVLILLEDCLQLILLRLRHRLPSLRQLLASDTLVPIGCVSGYQPVLLGNDEFFEHHLCKLYSKEMRLPRWPDLTNVAVSRPLVKIAEEGHRWH